MENVLQTWLINQCRMLSGAKHAVLLTGEPDVGPYDQSIYWPDEGQDHALLSRVAETALHLKQVVIKTRHNEEKNTGEPLDALACPLILGGRLFGVVAIEMTHRSQSMHQDAVRQVQAGANWLETMIQLQGSTAREQLLNLVDLVAAGTEHERFGAAAMEVANELAERFSCQRVSLGFLRYKRIRIEAMSHSDRIDQQSNLVRAIRDAMSESMDQGATVVYPEVADTAVLVTRFHAQLAQDRQGAAILTVPLIKNGQTVGAFLMERAQGNPFAVETVAQCEQIGLLLGPVLETRRSDERPLPVKILDSMRGGLGKMFGPHYLGLKAGVALGLVVLIWLTVAEGTFRISGDSELEAGICRAVVAPQQGYIAAAHVRAGDLVRNGDLLATLDDRELLLEQRKWQSQRSQLLKEYRRALAESNRAEVAILNAKRSQAEARLKLVNQQLERITLVAPFSGLIVKGDLSQALGSPVERGDVLFEVAPTDAYRVVMKVDDRDIGLVQPGQRGQLKLSGIPEGHIGITVDRLTPVSAAKEGRNYFRVEAVMDNHSDLMRPGMEGIAKIEAGREKLLWIWTRRLVGWLRLFAWSRLP